MGDLDLIKDLLSTSGAGRTGMKVLVFGESGSGKSPYLASFPRPLLAIDCGEGGIQPYLKAPEGNTPDLDRVKAGEEDLCVVVGSPEDLTKAAEFAMSQPWLKSVVIDGYNLAWEDHMEYWGDKIGKGDEKKIEMGQWRIVKRGWKARQKALMKSRLNFGMSAWMRDLAYEQVESANPMAKPRANVKAAEVAAIEKSVPYTTDLILQFSIVRDKKNRPTAQHEIRVAKGRRPRTIPPEELHVGTTWKFRSDKTEDLWALTMAKFEDRWKLASPADVAEHLGMDEEEARSADAGLVEAWGETEAGALIAGMLKAEKEGKITTVPEFATYWKKQVADTINEIESRDAVNAVLAVKENIKNRIKGGK
jgi:hypothetical protein